MIRRTTKQTLHTVAALIMLATMTICSVIGSTVVLCTEIDGRSHVEFAGGDCCVADSMGPESTEALECRFVDGDRHGCIDCTDVSLSNGHAIVPRWRAFDGIVGTQSCTDAVVVAFSSLSDRIVIRSFPTGPRTRDPVSGFVSLRLIC